MTRALSVVLAMAALVLCTSLAENVEAQPLRSQLHAQQLADLPAIKDAIVKAIGAEAATVELHATSNVFRVMLVNSKMNDAPAAGRENEASAIRSIVSQAITGKPDFKRIAAIRVEYLVRSHQNAKPKVVDLIEFRKDASGSFRHHVT
jgi:hypothetical protein